MKVFHRGPATISDQYRIFRIASIHHLGSCRRWLLCKSIASRCHQEDPTVRQEQQGESHSKIDRGKSGEQWHGALRYSVIQCAPAPATLFLAGAGHSRQCRPLSSSLCSFLVSSLVCCGVVAFSSGARQADAHVNNPEQYLSNPSNPFFVKTLGKKIDVLYVSHLVTEKYGLQFGPHNSPMLYLLPNEKIEANTKIYGGCACFNGWAAIC
ncbi:hypothetical protein DY000_02026042 [Brassica cretica]|uniref:Uncharacterized protein n=1 Tax=Brassica cretica TaxID=69181 RepID=A0ABQ7EKW9_BRACR|nr:hypothetical protein DY000_02026042 [Brassica cretica]